MTHIVRILPAKPMIKNRLINAVDAAIPAVSNGRTNGL